MSIPPSSISWSKSLFLDVILFVLALIYLLTCPYTKVEESFNVQAMHDFLFTPSLSEFDHFTYPGVVPRSLLPPAILSFIARIFVNSKNGDKIYAALWVRAILAFFVIVSLHRLRHATVKYMGDIRGHVAITIIHASQFHLLFYASRPLANIYALIGINFAMSAWMDVSRIHTQKLSNNKSCFFWFIYALTITTFVVRCDMLLLSGCVVLASLLYRWISIWQCIKYGLISSIFTILITVPFDTYYWQYPVWPEWSVLMYNTIQNGGKNSEMWGTEPWYWYFTSALPRALLASFLLLPFALFPSLPYLVTSPSKFFNNLRSSLHPHRCLSLFLPILGFIILYSILPHKELRFILPCVPMLNGIAAYGLLRLYDHRHTSLFARIISLGSLFSLVLSFIISCIFVYISAHNYPGGEALAQFHQLAPIPSPGPFPIIHLDNLACISGASRFGQRDDLFKYSKKEGLSSPSDYLSYDYLIHPNTTIPGFHQLQPHNVSTIYAYQRMDWKHMRLITEPVLYIHARDNNNNRRRDTLIPDEQRLHATS